MNKTVQIGNLPEKFLSETEIPARTARWQQELARAIRQPAELLRRLDLSEHLLPEALQSHQEFPLLVPESFLNRMQPGNPNDPLLLQVLPAADEQAVQPGFHIDAVGDEAAELTPGLLQKYTGRALMITLGQCAVHCRYCFRRHYPYQTAPAARRQWQEALQSLEQHPQIEEIILSGGDPLILSDRKLGELLTELEALPQLTRLRIHSRLPIVLPSRVTTELLQRFQQSRLQVLLVVHANHFAEIAADCAEALKCLVRSGFPVLNQAVLLKGINDTANIQTELCRRLINLGVIPYYLHQLDRVQGAAHFETAETTGREIIETLKTRLPGYAIPRLVREIAGEKSKTELK